MVPQKQDIQWVLKLVFQLFDIDSKVIVRPS